ncbi:hypothetical protein J2Z66_004351 [Paenibacillus eucommiae]|uniref:Uncharacterized protein n=1 Tax=Paenibacillus eucommiae TaxID=1355755 RepID=A0ABS4IYR7_9BACL|nr:hypothetical protein [Paenibacillus eucommiae]
MSNQRKRPPLAIYLAALTLTVAMTKNENKN